jgi:hypothetical protein
VAVAAIHRRLVSERRRHDADRPRRQHRPLVVEPGHQHVDALALLAEHILRGQDRPQAKALKRGLPNQNFQRFSDLTSLAEEAGEMHGILTADVAKDEEGFPIPDDSDLSDAWKTLEHLETRLTRLAFMVAREGDDG